MKQILQMCGLIGLLIVVIVLSGQPSLQAVMPIDVQPYLYQWVIPIVLGLQMVHAMRWRIKPIIIVMSWVVLASVIYFVDPTALVTELIDMSLINVGVASLGALVGQWLFQREQLRMSSKQAVMIFIPVMLSVMSWLAVTFIEYALAESGLIMRPFIWVLLAIVLLVIGIVNRHLGVPFVWQCVSLILAVVGLWFIQASASIPFTQIHRIYSYYFVIHSVGYAIGAIPVWKLKNRLK